MPHRSLSRRVTKISSAITPAIDPAFRAFAAAVIRFGGNEPTTETTERLARWLAEDRHSMITGPAGGTG